MKREDLLLLLLFLLLALAALLTLMLGGGRSRHGYGYLMPTTGLPGRNFPGTVYRASPETTGMGAGGFPLVLVQAAAFGVG